MNLFTIVLSTQVTHDTNDNNIGNGDDDVDKDGKKAGIEQTTNEVISRIFSDSFHTDNNEIRPDTQKLKLGQR